MSTKTYTGACLCSKIKYRIDLPADQPVPKIVLCHCNSCKRYTGSAYSSNIIVPQSALTFTSGEPKLFMDDTDAGPKLRRQFCGDCGSPLTSEPNQNPDIIVIKSGTLDDRDLFTEMGAEIYCSRKDQFLDKLNGAHPRMEKGT
ncbi:DUF636 domain protein [Paecilomyces variotii No. 5]|uniref:DUF636 domain protein n=1 Tax=Byssochlamys spectabilis (strain No. 5 / NBRC 109023) TaxID=1356009 RepID=V5I404_BYSSN|nr:DUF636 domain protein [Paecilomyces variotii No. 5]